MTAIDLQWTKQFWKSVRPYVFLRETDQVLILPPNQVFKLNPSALGLLKYLDGGGHFEGIPGWNQERARQVQEFFEQVKLAYEGQDPGAQPVPYSFDFTRLPVLGEIAVTYRCNNRCVFCYAGCGGASGCGLPPGWENKKEMTTAQIRKVIDVFHKQAQIPFFSFTGGEPLIRKDLEELMAYAVKKGLRINLISNGTLVTPQRAASLYKAGLRTAQISLEGATAQLHDELCGLKGAFERTLAGIRNLQEAGIRVQTNTTITRPNHETLLEILPLLAERGVTRFSMNLFIPTKASPLSQELFIPYSQIGPIVDRVAAKAKEMGLTFYWYSPTPLCHYNPMARGMGNKSCAACDGLVHVDPEGQVLPCSSYSQSVGNILKQDFESLWFGEKAQFFKQKEFAPEICKKCSRFTACQGACPLYWEYAGTEELTRAGGAK